MIYKEIYGLREKMSTWGPLNITLNGDKIDNSGRLSLDGLRVVGIFFDLTI